MIVGAIGITSVAAAGWESDRGLEECGVILMLLYARSREVTIGPCGMIGLCPLSVTPELTCILCLGFWAPGFGYVGSLSGGNLHAAAEG